MPQSVRLPSSRSLLAAALASLVLLAGAASAQGFDADRYLAQCLRFEAGEDYTSAREACRNALQIDADRMDVRLALARVEVALGAYASAEARLDGLVGRVGGAEPALLLAEIAIEEERLGAAEARLRTARAQLEANPDRDLSAHLAYLQGRLLEAQGRVNEALDAYGAAVEADPLDVDYRLADARLRFRLGDAAGARTQLEAYQALSGDDRDPRVRSLLGRSLWAAGDLEAAAGQLETALALWGNRQTGEQASDLRTLGYVYLGQGDLGRGTLALREASRRGNQLVLLGGNLLLWLLVLLGLLVAHLLAESRIETRSTLEVVEGPQLWSVGSVYGTLLLAAAAALAAGVGAGVLLYDNLMALVTPYQAGETRALMASVFALVALLLAIRTVRAAGWRAGSRLLGPTDAVVGGLLLGLALLAVTLGYLALRPESPFFSDLWIDLSRLSPILAVGMVVLPLSELVFRPFTFDALERRYDRGSALLITAALSTLVLATPVILLLPFGLVLAEAYRRTRSGAMTLAAQLTLHIGLVVATLLSPWARGLFL
jgi:tetratricopeptide (TPR) repeat protein